MSFNIYILISVLAFIICSPPPEVQSRLKETFTQKPTLINKSKSSNLKTLKASASTYFVSNKVIIYYEKDEIIEEHEKKIGTKNVPNGSYFSSYAFYFTKKNGRTLKAISYSCQKIISGDQISSDKCTSSFKEDDEKYNFIYTCNFGNNEQLLIKYKYSITQEKKNILYRQEDATIPKTFSGAKCDYKFILPQNYKSLGLKYNRLKKENDCLYTYNGVCPSEDLVEVIRMSPQKTYWKAGMTTTSISKTAFKGYVTMKFLRMYKGAKYRNKNYKLTRNDNHILNEPALITEEIFIKAELPGKNQQQVGVRLNTSFINNLNNDFVTYTSDKFYNLDTNINDAIKKKVDEIINDNNSEYKDYPNYYKIGKFIYNYLTYDSSYSGKDLTPIEIFNGKKGVCEHYTILYNNMLNYIGIKTLTIVGYGFQSGQVLATEKTTGHAWTAALINGKIMELDATWDLFEGISAAHVFKGFNKESYSSQGVGLDSISNTHYVQLIDNLDGENEDSIYIEKKFLYNKANDEVEKECKVSLSNSNDQNDSGNSGNSDNSDDSGNSEEILSYSNHETDSFTILNPSRGDGNSIKISKISICLYIIIFILL